MAQPASVIAREIKPGIGYVKIAFFPGVNGQRFARELDRALGGIRECTRLIVDLRGNLGGFVGSLRLMSYLTPDQYRSATASPGRARIASGDAINWLASTSCRKRSSTPSGWQFGSSCCTVIARSVS